MGVGGLAAFKIYESMKNEPIHMGEGTREFIASTDKIQFNEKTGEVAVDDGVFVRSLTPREGARVKVEMKDPSTIEFTHAYPKGGETLTVIKKPDGTLEVSSGGWDEYYEDLPLPEQRA